MQLHLRHIPVCYRREEIEGTVKNRASCRLHHDRMRRPDINRGRLRRRRGTDIPGLIDGRHGVEMRAIDNRLIGIGRRAHRKEPQVATTAADLRQTPIAVDQIAQQIELAIGAPGECDIGARHGNSQTGWWRRGLIINGHTDLGRTHIAIQIFGFQLYAVARPLAQPRRIPLTEDIGLDRDGGLPQRLPDHRRRSGADRETIGLKIVLTVGRATDIDDPTHRSARRRGKRVWPGVAQNRPSR